jgi:hypothetical protein
MNSIKRLALAAFAATIILMGVAPAAQDSLHPGNFNEAAALDTSQVLDGKQAVASLEVFCFDTIDDTGWSCFPAASIPDEYAANDYDRAVWYGPLSEMKAAYERLGA